MQICSCLNSSTTIKVCTIVGVVLLVTAAVAAVAAAALFFGAPALLLSLGVSAFQMSILSGCSGVIGAYLVALNCFKGKQQNYPSEPPSQTNPSRVASAPFVSEYENRFHFEGPASRDIKDILKKHVLECIHKQELSEEKINRLWTHLICYELPQNEEILRTTIDSYSQGPLYLLIYNNKQEWANGRGRSLHRITPGAVVLKVLIENGQFMSGYVKNAHSSRLPTEDFNAAVDMFICP